MSEEYSSDESDEMYSEHYKDVREGQGTTSSSSSSAGSSSTRYFKWIESTSFFPFIVDKVDAENVTAEWLRQTGFLQPFLVKKHKKLGLVVPSTKFNVDDIAKICGANCQVTVHAMDDLYHAENDWTISEWTSYMAKNSSNERILHCARLEFSTTPLASKVKPPQFVKDLGWIENVWPKERREIGDFPQTQLYCMLNVGESYIDFHMDMGGSSAWYHLLKGKMTFYLVPPLEEYLGIFECWASSHNKKNMFFAQLVSKCYKLELEAGDTFVLPSGWIYAIHSTENSIAFGGFFLHNLTIPMQLRAYEMEKKCNVPLVYQYPQFMATNWYAAANLLTCLRRDLGNDPDEKRKLTSWEYDGLEPLINSLQDWSDKMRNPTKALGDVEQQTKASAYMAAQAVDCSGPQHLIDEIRELSSKCTSIRLDKKKIFIVEATSSSGSESDEDSSISSVEQTKHYGYEKHMEANGRLKLRFKAGNLPLPLPIDHHDAPASYDSSMKNESEEQLSKSKQSSRAQEDIWNVKCSCGASGENYDDGLRMIACDSCEVWQHTMCSGILDGSNPPDSFLCKSCQSSTTSQEEDWQVNCSCGVSAKNYDDGWRMVACEACNTWQHTMCVGIPNEKEPPANYKCNLCKQSKKRKPTTKNNGKTKKNAKVEKKSMIVASPEKPALSDDEWTEESTVASPIRGNSDDSPKKPTRRKANALSEHSNTRKKIVASKTKKGSPSNSRGMTQSQSQVDSKPGAHVGWSVGSSKRKKKTKPQTVRQRLCRKLGSSASFRR